MAGVAIIGKAGAVPTLGDVERWSCNDTFRYHPGLRWDRWFDLHAEDESRQLAPEAWPWYQQQDARRPIYLLDVDPTIAGSVAYPRGSVQQAFAWGDWPEEFFTSSIDWMLAFAIREGFTRIELHGVDMFDGHERKVQREGAHYWIGMARGRGIDVVIPDASSLTKTERLYGYQTLTSPRNFASMSLRRFLLQCRDADRMKGEGHVSCVVTPGVDESAVARRESA